MSAVQSAEKQKTLKLIENQGLLVFVGGPDETRTRDPLRDRQVF